ncbi:MAG: hypothetical protein PHI97_14615 [Desulfobulbus sp.]|nr:hypothetical protein [Desulfobulbus sp.]
MSKITIYRFQVYSVINDNFQKSRRWGTRDAIERIAWGEILEDTATEVDESAIASDITCLTIIDFNHHRRTGFQTKVE